MSSGISTAQTASTGRRRLRRRRHAQGSSVQQSEFDPGQLQPKQLHRRRRYTRSRINMLARQYVKLRSDLLIAALNVTDSRSTEYARRGKEYLTVAREELESRKPRIYVCSSLLYLAESNLAWLYAPGMLQLRSEATLNRLEKLHGADDVTWLLSNLKETRDKEDTRWRRAALADALDYFSQQDQKLLLDDDLQVTRLRSLLWYVGTALVLLVIAVPYVTISLGQGIQGWPVVRFSQVWLTQEVSALAVSAVGAVGGIFSGLVSTRDSSTTLDEYRTSMLKLALKPLVGAVASITLYLLLSWQILTGVKVTNGGTFLLVGFLAGFSERYFLKMLHISPEDGNKQDARHRDQLVSAITAPSLPSSSEERQALFDTEPSCSLSLNGKSPTAANEEEPDSGPNGESPATPHKVESDPAPNGESPSASNDATGRP
jgi:hypothetical protein